MKKIIVSVTNDLATDQRVERVCGSLHQWAYDVLLVGRVLPDSPDFSRPYCFKRMKLLFNKGFLFYAEYNLRLFFYLLINKADILLANDLDTLPANYLASKFKGCRLIFDSHEYFSETPEVYQRKFVKNFWLFIERKLIKRIDACYTVSASIARKYKELHNVDFRVIRNVPCRYDILVIEDHPIPFIIYQGAVNVGRGLELLVQVMALLPAYQLVIVGDGPELDRLKLLVKSKRLEQQVIFTGRLLPGNLRELTSRAAVGVSIEEPLGESYKSALPNKLFDYIQAGVPVLVSDLPEMRAVVNQYGVGVVLEDRNPNIVAASLHAMITNEIQRNEWKKNLSKASQELCWEKESVKLKELFEDLCK